MTASAWTPQAVSAVIAAAVALVGAIAGLITALHGHGVATQANARAQSAETHAAATSDGVDRLTTLLAPSVRVAPAASLPQTPTMTIAAGYSGLNGAQLDTLVGWLREQHKTQIGSYPEESQATTDWSQVITRISQIRSGQ